MALLTTATRTISSADQARHYFGQPHLGIPREPIDHASAWKGQDLAREPDGWTHQLSPVQVRELSDAVLATQHLPLADIEPGNFPLPTLGPITREWMQQVHLGRGFQWVTGIPVGQWTEAEAQRAYWGLGQHMGQPGAQNPEGELLGHVKDYGEQAGRPEVRLYRTASHIRYHCDASDVVGLLCLQPSASGGASRIVSSVSIFNQVMATEPELIPALFEPFMIDSRGEEPPGRDPWNLLTPCAWDRKLLHTFFHSDYFRSVARFANAPKFTPAQQRLLDLYESIGNDPQFYLDMNFAAGDLQLVSNHRVLHARTEYQDDPATPRHLLRLWLTADADTTQTK